MEKIGIIITVVGSVAVLTFLSWLITRLINHGKNNGVKTLVSCFGEPSYSDVFSLAKVK